METDVRGGNRPQIVRAPGNSSGRWMRNICKNTGALIAALLFALSLFGSPAVFGQTASTPTITCTQAGCVESVAPIRVDWSFIGAWLPWAAPQFSFPSADAACKDNTANTQYWIVNSFTYVGIIPYSPGYYQCKFISKIDGSPYYSGYVWPVGACPTPTADPAIPYTFNRATGMCERPAQKKSTLTITLQGDSSTVPWNKLKDPQHLLANVPFTAVVVNNGGPPPANLEVTITSDVTAKTGGHQHTNARPKGKLSATPAGIATAPNTFHGFTDSNGVVTFVFGAEEASGIHTLTATCSGCTAGNATVEEKIQNLLRLDNDQICTKYFDLKGGWPAHPDNHYYETYSYIQILKLGVAFMEEYGELLQVNDSSLIKGGLYDINGGWSPSHKNHRKGIVVDINNFKERDLEFEQFVADHYAFASWEGKNVSPTPHYHIRLLGINRDE
jgi:hypothetical protein